MSSGCGVYPDASSKVVGWSMGDRLASELVKRALKQAIEQRSPGEGLLVRSDQGKEYYAIDYQALVMKNVMLGSMSRKVNCYDYVATKAFDDWLPITGSV